MSEPGVMATADADDLARLLTTCVRADRFCDGSLRNAFKAGLIGRVIGRAEQLLALVAPDEMPTEAPSLLAPLAFHRLTPAEPSPAPPKAA